jgi:hypothetical protein
MGLFQKNRKEPMPELPKSLAIQNKEFERGFDTDRSFDVQEEEPVQIQTPKPTPKVEPKVEEEQQIDFVQLLIVMQRELVQIIAGMEILAKRQELLSVRIENIEQLIKQNIN